METALLLMIAAVIGGGVAGALLQTWSLHRRTYSLEDRVLELETNTTREVKKRAAEARLNRPTAEAELAAFLKAQKESQSQEELPYPFNQIGKF